MAFYLLDKTIFVRSLSSFYCTCLLPMGPLLFFVLSNSPDVILCG